MYYSICLSLIYAYSFRSLILSSNSCLSSLHISNYFSTWLNFFSHIIYIYFIFSLYFLVPFISSSTFSRISFHFSPSSSMSSLSFKIFKFNIFDSFYIAPLLSKNICYFSFFNLSFDPFKCSSMLFFSLIIFSLLIMTSMITWAFFRSFSFNSSIILKLSSTPQLSASSFSSLLISDSFSYSCFMIWSFSVLFYSNKCALSFWWS